MATVKTRARDRVKVLVVEDDVAVAEVIAEIVGAEECEVIVASTLAEARQIIAGEPVGLLVADLMLPDGEGLELLGELNKRRPDAAAVIVSGVGTLDGAIEAMRGGAVDFVAKPFTADDLGQRVRKALSIQKARGRQGAKIDRLKSAVKKLNEARKVVEKKVDLLCNDLISAYGELSKQFDQVRVQEGYRAFVERSGNLEQLLCHTMDWLLRQVGYSNIGIWLTGPDNGTQLGAYMKYTVAAEAELAEALQKNLLRLAVRRGFFRFKEADLAANLTPAELRVLIGHEVVGINCTYLGESLGVILLFRDAKTPFSDDDITSIKTMCPLFALELAKAVRLADDAAESDPETKLPLEEGEENPTKKKSKKDPADWWKRGEEPPF